MTKNDKDSAIYFLCYIDIERPGRGENGNLDNIIKIILEKIMHIFSKLSLLWGPQHFSINNFLSP